MSTVLLASPPVTVKLLDRFSGAVKMSLLTPLPPENVRLLPVTVPPAKVSVALPAWPVKVAVLNVTLLEKIRLITPRLAPDVVAPAKTRAPGPLVRNVVPLTKSETVDLVAMLVMLRLSAKN